MGLFPCCGYVQSVPKYFWDSEPVLHLHSSNISDLLLEGGLVPGYSILKPKQKKTKKKQLWIPHIEDKGKHTINNILGGSK